MKSSFNGVSGIFRDARNMEHLLKKISAIRGVSNRHVEAGKASQVHRSPDDMMGVSDFEHACTVLGEYIAGFNFTFNW